MNISFNNIPHGRYMNKTNAVNSYKPAVSFETVLNEKLSGSYSVKSDTVSISADAVSYNFINKAVKDIADDVNSAGLSKISQIKESLANGTYDISAGDVADAILSRFGF